MDTGSAKVWRFIDFIIDLIVINVAVENRYFFSIQRMLKEIIDTQRSANKSTSFFLGEVLLARRIGEG